MRTLRCQVLVSDVDLPAIEQWLQARDLLLPEAAEDILRCVVVQARVQAPRRTDFLTAENAEIAREEA